MAADLTIYNDMLQEYYAARPRSTWGYKDHPLLAMIPKKTNWGGQASKYIIPLHVETLQAVANDFDRAREQGQRHLRPVRDGPEEEVRLRPARPSALLASAQNPKASAKLYTAEVDGTIAQMRRDIAWGLYRNSHAKRGTVGSFSAGSSSTITLADRTEVVGFSVGMRIVFGRGLGPRRRLHDRLGVRRLPDHGDQPLDRRPDRHRQRHLERGARERRPHPPRGRHRGRGTFLGAEGLGDHPPDRAQLRHLPGRRLTVDTDRLAGLRLDGSALTIEEALIEAGMRLRRRASPPAHLLHEPDQVRPAVKELGSKVQHDKVKAPGAASVGFDAIKVYTPAGTLPVIPDADCPYDQIWVLTMKTWTLASVGMLPQLADDDVRMLRSSTADEYEVRLAAYYNLGCSDPGANLRIDQ